MINDRIREVIRFLVKLRPNSDWDEVEQDIKSGYTTLEAELYNMTKALLLLKINNNNQKLATGINQCLKILTNENLKYGKCVA